MNLLAAIALHEAAGHTKTPVDNNELRRLIKLAEGQKHERRNRTNTRKAKEGASCGASDQKPKDEA